MFISPGKKSVLILISIIMFGMTWIGCNRQDGNQTEMKEAPPPPSLTTTTTGVNADTTIVQLTDKQVQELGIRTYKVQKRKFRYPITAPGVVQGAPGHISIVSAPVNGRVVKIYAHEGESVKEGDVLLELESLEFANLGADYLQAYAESRFQEQQMKRIKLLVEKKISPQRTLEKTEMDYARAIAMERSALARLKALGVPDQQIKNWQSGLESKPVLKLMAPISGTINEHLIELGQSVNAYDKMLSIINTKRVLVRGFVPPDDATYLKPGDSLIIYPKLNRYIFVKAAITTINPALDEKNKSKVVNIITESNKSWPIPGQNVQLDIMTEYPMELMVIPLSAVEYEEKQPAVFVRLDPKRY
ncbi:MAG TPA: efflux RND transporter periplasmic adaptor subunit, partial [Balneolales bacterium]|nr:efflux RND transporter periplasmic adaptor subunit [Balneolales bacterium]